MKRITNYTLDCLINQGISAVAYASLAELVDAHFHWECREIHQGSNP